MNSRNTYFHRNIASRHGSSDRRVWGITEIVGNFIIPENKIIPIYLLPRTLMINRGEDEYESITWQHSRVNSRNSEFKYIEDLIPIRATGEIYKSLGKSTIDIFKEDASVNGLKKIVLNDEFIYYFGKGIITDKDYNPIIVTMHTLEDASELNGGGFTLLPERMHVYIRRDAITDEFKESDRRMYNLIRNRLLPELLETNIKISFRRDLNFMMQVHPNPRDTEEDLKQLVLESSEKIKRTLIERLS